MGAVYEGENLLIRRRVVCADAETDSDVAASLLPDGLAEREPALAHLRHRRFSAACLERRSNRRQLLLGFHRRFLAHGLAVLLCVFLTGGPR